MVVVVEVVVAVGIPFRVFVVCLHWRTPDSRLIVLARRGHATVEEVIFGHFGHFVSKYF